MVRSVVLRPWVQTPPMSGHQEVNMRSVCVTRGHQKSKTYYQSVAGPGFPGYGAPTIKVGVPNYYFAQFFPRNVMTIKIFGTKGGGGASLGPP